MVTGVIVDQFQTTLGEQGTTIGIAFSKHIIGSSLWNLSCILLLLYLSNGVGLLKHTGVLGRSYLLCCATAYC